MADSKEAKLSIVIRTVDQATARIKAINEQLDKAQKPVKDFKKALSDLREKSGLDGVISGFKGVGGAVTDLLGKLAMVGGIAGVAVGGLMHIINGFDELGDKAEQIGVSVDFLAQMRYAAERSGVEVETLDQGLKGFVSSLGQARAGTGKMAGFLKKVSPVLLDQVKAAKSNEEAFDLMADAMAKVKDPAKRAALAQKTFGDSALAPLLARGAKGVAELRGRYLELAGSQEDAAKKSGEVDDAMKDLHASTDGIKAALASGLAPALKVIVAQLSEWFSKHRGDVAAWAKDIGEKLPGAVKAVAEWIGKAYDKVAAFVDKIGGAKGVLIGLGAVTFGPLLASLVSLTGQIITMISRVGDLAGGLGGLKLPGGGAAGAAEGAASTGGAVAGTVTGLGLVAAGAAAYSQWGMRHFGKGTDVLRDFAKDTSDNYEVRDVGGHKVFAPKSASWSKLVHPEEQGADLSAAPMSSDDFQGAGGGSSGDVSGLAGHLMNALGQMGKNSEAKITIDIAGAPKGTRVSVDPKSTADIDLNTGYQMGATP